MAIYFFKVPLVIQKPQLSRKLISLASFAKEDTKRRQFGSSVQIHWLITNASDPLEESTKGSLPPSKEALTWGVGAEEHTAHISVASRESDLKALLWCSRPTGFAGRLTLFLERRSEVTAFWKAEWWCRKRLGFGTSKTRWIPVFLLQDMEDT